MIIDDLLTDVKSVAIFGHVRPDGDCLGSTLGLYNYIKGNYPAIEVHLFLERFPENYKILANSNNTNEIYDEECGTFDLAFLIDTPSFDRIGANGEPCAPKTMSMPRQAPHAKYCTTCSTLKKSARTPPNAFI